MCVNGSFGAPIPPTPDVWLHITVEVANLPWLPTINFHFIMW